MVVDGALDLLGKYFAVAFFKTLTVCIFTSACFVCCGCSCSTNSPQQKEEFETKVLPTWYGYFDKILKQHRDGTEFVISDVSYAMLFNF